MRKSWPAVLALLIALLPFNSSFAGQEMLDSLIVLALRNNPDIRSAGYQKDAASDRAKSSGSLPDPQLSIGLLNLPVSSFAFDETPMSGVALGLTQKIPWPGELNARSDIAATKQLQAAESERSVENRIVREVTNAYFDYSYWAKSDSIIGDYLKLLDATSQISQTKYANGDAPAQDVLRIGSMLSRIEVRRLKTDQNRYTSLLRLRQATGDSSLPEMLPASLPELGEVRTDSLSVASNPMVANARLGVDQALAGERLARSGYRPDFNVGVDYRFRKDVPGDPVHGEDFLTFKFGLNLPLWFFSKQKHEVSSAKQTVMAAREKERSINDILNRQLEATRSQLSLIAESLNKYDSSVLPQTEAAVQAAEIAYEVGEVDFNALLAAHSDLLESRLERLDLLRQYHKTMAALEELQGIGKRG